MLKLYYANIGLLNDEQVFQSVLEKVNVQRREKVLRCKQKKDQIRSLLAGYLLRIALEKEGMDYEKTSISILENGKPVISGNLDLHFSLSHAGDYAVCVISNYRIGVDIETRTKSIFLESNEEQLQAVAKKILSFKEWKQYEVEKKENKIELFLQFWTRKESYSKADGRGLGLGIDKVETDSEKFFSKWIDEDTMLSIYVEDEKISDLQTEEIWMV